jgi:hypothetical protein
MQAPAHAGPGRCRPQQQLCASAAAQVGAVLFDEFHERNLDSDLSLALCLDAQRLGRPDLRLAVMSVGAAALRGGMWAHTHCAACRHFRGLLLATWLVLLLATCMQHPR